MLKFIALVIFVCSATAWKADKKPDFTTIDGVANFLETFNYMAPPEDGAGAAQATVSFRNALADFQKFVGLPPTGEMNQETLKWMNKSRCGMPDREKQVSRHKRFVLEGSKWKGPTLTYRKLNSAPTLEPQLQDFIISRAFQTWSDLINLDFERVPWYENADIDLTFLSYGHGDHESFDGRGGILAHGFYPYYGGDIHFDNDDNWTYEDPTNSGTDFFSTVVHEIGHILGLAHSDVKGAVMWPYIMDYDPDFKLHPDDVNGIHRLYEPRRNAPTYAPVATAPSVIVVETPTRIPLKEFDATDFCFEGPIDAGVTDGNGSTYIFRGEWFYEVDNVGVVDGYPIKISESSPRGFSPMSGPVDGALYLEATNEILLFKTYYYASFINRTFQGWGIIHQRFPGIPPNIDDAFVWPSNNKTYFLKGEIYWRLNESGLIDPNYPKPMRGWDMPYGVDAAFVYKNKRLYLFRGPRYYRFNDNNYKIDYGYPRDISHWWFGCQTFDRAERPPQSSFGSADGPSEGSVGSSGTRRARALDATSENRDINPRFRRATGGANQVELSAMLSCSFIGGVILSIL